MKSRFLFLLSYLIFWLVFCVDSRILFFLYHYPMASSLSLRDIILPFAYGLRMDLSLCGYLMILPSLFMALPFSSSGWLRSFFFIYTVSLLFINGIIVVTDLELYRNWGFRMDVSVIEYLKSPKEAAASLDIKPVLILLSIYIIWITLAVIVCRIWLLPLLKKITKVNLAISVPVFILTGTLWIIPVRGSFSVAPMNPGFVYYNPEIPFVNHAGINVVWNLWQTIASRKMPEPKQFFTKEKALGIAGPLIAGTQYTGDTVINNNRPNVLLIIAESLTAKIIEPLGGIKNITPGFTGLCNEGILFTNFYASGDRTDKGLLSILSGTPGHPQLQMMKYSSRSRNLPNIAGDLAALGYNTSFVYGGDSDFINMKSFLIEGGFHNIIDGYDFPSHLNTGKWGVHDEFVLEKLLEITSSHTEPFFNTCLTQSNHEPFIVPMPTVFHGDDEGNRFKNSAFYADSVLYDFIGKAKKTAWWDNTLIIILADHGTRHPDNGKLENPIRFHIPMLWLGGALKDKYKGSIISRHGSQNDLANTLLCQIKDKSDNYPFSFNMLNYHQPSHSNSASSFGLFTYTGGFGIVADSAGFIYDIKFNDIVFNEGINKYPLFIDSAKAYMQVVMEWFYNLNKAIH